MPDSRMRPSQAHLFASAAAAGICQLVSSFNIGEQGSCEAGSHRGAISEQRAWRGEEEWLEWLKWSK